MNQDKVEAAKNIAQIMITASHYNQLGDEVFDNYIREICQLFEQHFLEWLTKHGSQQQVELFKEEMGCN